MGKTEFPRGRRDPSSWVEQQLIPRGAGWEGEGIPAGLEQLGAQGEAGGLCEIVWDHMGLGKIMLG